MAQFKYFDVCADYSLAQMEVSTRPADAAKWCEGFAFGEKVNYGYNEYGELIYLEFPADAPCINGRYL